MIPAVEEPGDRPRPAGAPAGGLQVATPVFEGPMELLLALAERRQVDILQVPLARLTDDYLVAIASLSEPDPDEMAEFLRTAARLLLLKSISLLPGEDADEEETELLGWEEDVRRRMEEYRAYREMAEGLMARAAEEAHSYPPPARVVEVEGQEESLQIDALVVAFQSLLARVPPRPVVVVGRAWSVDDKLAALESMVARGPVELVGLLLSSQDRLEAVVTFVALLELLRRGEVRVRQRESFGEIWVQKRPPPS
jgi:segregation and condensation protein A